ncbi:hypothetical protein BO70DRAFT_397891 [Aspergillus heteromorphus CBS 117.55]|uniref:F-box domain-containing protein n=1 Tax=Aspergillus heteromorphus CBS 117.55 TaxID=1448321 RepID=A0A317VVK7_9EURO|nr:uncharacterized protein BO70DRAFT_397891 [Aspergillus heteromorphus CBS 117.55]PWY77002.1 hypothetical protein BO70DRAFT_397891 [Aspergillus heteromorphus CBS 117.55]
MQPLGSLVRGSHDPLLNCMICKDSIAKHKIKSYTSGFRAWNYRVKLQSFVCVHTSELMNKPFSPPELWKGLYRAIIYNAGTYCLSGVSILHEGKDHTGIMVLPRDSDAVFVGKPEKAPNDFIEAYMETIYDVTRREPRGYAMHERCWALAIQVMGADVIKANLGFFMNGMMNSWRYIDLGPVPPIIGPRLIVHYREKEYKGSAFELEDPADCQTWVKQQQEREAVGLLAGWKKKAMVLSRGVRRSTHIMCLRSNPKKTLADLVPPEDIVMMILDLLSAGDIESFLTACPRWEQVISARYWRRRAIKVLKLEFEEVPDEKDLNWKDVYYRTGSGLPIDSLRNRHRIITHLEDVKGLLQKSLGSAKASRA